MDQKSVIAVNTDLSTSPHLMKKSATEWANTPRPARSVASGLNQAKRAKKGTQKNQKADEVLGEFVYPCYFLFDEVFVSLFEKLYRAGHQRYSPLPDSVLVKY